jgi:hypothetical protein
MHIIRKKKMLTISSNKQKKIELNIRFFFAECRLSRLIGNQKYNTRKQSQIFRVNEKKAKQ